MKKTILWVLCALVCMDLIGPCNMAFFADIATIGMDVLNNVYPFVIICALLVLGAMRIYKTNK